MTEAVDVDGLRIILLPSAFEAEPHKGRWSDDGHGERVDLAGAFRRLPVFVATHHYPQRVRSNTSTLPACRRGQARPFLRGARPCGARLDRRRAATPTATIGVHYKSLLLTEMGSTKDYPGVWAGYAVYEGGITQVPYPVAEPSARAWIDRTGGTILGSGSGGRRMASHRAWSGVASRVDVSVTDDYIALAPEPA